MNAGAGTTEPTERSAALVAAGVLLSRVSGIAREVVLAAWLGATTVAAEAFAFALSVPKILQNLLGEGALSASFIPVYAQTVDADPRAARRLAGAVFGLLAALVSGLVLVLMVGAAPIVAVLAGGRSPSAQALIVDLLRVMAPGIGFIVFAAWCLGVLNAHREFFRSYVAPVLWNAAIVIAVLAATTQTSDLADLARAASWGVFIGGVAQFAVLLPRVLAIAGPITPTLDRTLDATRTVIRRFVPGVAGRGVVTLSTFVDLALSSFLAVGALSILTKAQTLYLLPISVFAISIAAADLPELARSPMTAAPNDAARRVERSVDRVAFFLILSFVVFVFAGRPVVGALFERREFSSDDTAAVWAVLAVMSFGLVASGLSRLLQNAAFAAGDVGGPARIALVRLVTAAVIGVALMWPADRFAIVNGVIRQLDDVAYAPLDDAVRAAENSHRLGAVGLAAGGAIAAWLEFVLLRRRVGSTAKSLGLRRVILRLLPAAVIAAIVLAVLEALFSGLHPLLAAPVVVGPAAVLYLLVAYRFRSRTARDLIGLATGPGSAVSSTATSTASATRDIEPGDIERGDIER